MSEHTTDTVIRNKNATIRRLVKDRDQWKRIARAAIDMAERMSKLLEQKGGAS